MGLTSSVMMLPQMPNFSNSKANLTPIYVQPSAPQIPVLNTEDLKQVKYYISHRRKLLNIFHL